MRGFYYVLCWLVTLFIGLVIVTAISGEARFGMAFTLIAGGLSLPFILIFWSVMYGIIKKKPTRNDLHKWTFFLHVAGSLFTYIALIIFDTEFAFPLAGIMAGYFALDSILFHVFIQLKHPVRIEKISSPEILDDMLAD